MDMKTNIKNNDINYSEPRITNIVATGRFPKSIDIVEAYNKIDFPIKEYEPETYPALLVKVDVNGKLKHVTIYKNDKYIITGAKSEKEVKEIYVTIFSILKNRGFL